MKSSLALILASASVCSAQSVDSVHVEHPKYGPKEVIHTKSADTYQSYMDIDGDGIVDVTYMFRNHTYSFDQYLQLVSQSQRIKPAVCVSRDNLPPPEKPNHLFEAMFYRNIFGWREYSLESELSSSCSEDMLQTIKDRAQITYDRLRASQKGS